MERFEVKQERNFTVDFTNREVFELAFDLGFFKCCVCGKNIDATPISDPSLPSGTLKLDIKDAISNTVENEIHYMCDDCVLLGINYLFQLAIDQRKAATEAEMGVSE